MKVCGYFLQERLGFIIETESVRSLDDPAYFERHFRNYNPIKLSCLPYTSSSVWSRGRSRVKLWIAECKATTATLRWFRCYSRSHWTVYQQVIASHRGQVEPPFSVSSYICYHIWKQFQWNARTYVGTYFVATCYSASCARISLVCFYLLHCYTINEFRNRGWCQIVALSQLRV
jgi:hypothetical protein